MSVWLRQPIQLCDYRNGSPDSVIHGITFINHNNGSFSLTGTAQSAFTRFFDDYRTQNIVLGHKYLFFTSRTSIGSAACVYDSKNGCLYAATRTYCFFTSGLNSERAAIYVLFNKNDTLDTTFYPQLFDLTATYGAGNEPTTIEQFRADYPEEYYPYNPPYAIFRGDMWLRRRAMLGQWKNLKFNQLVKNGNFENTSDWSGIKCTLSAVSNRFIVTSTDNNFLVRSSCETIVIPIGHTLYLHCGNVDKSGMNGHIVQTSLVKSTGNTFDYTITGNSFGMIINPNFDVYGFGFYGRTSVSGDYFSVEKYMAIDLTAMYGAGNEPTTVEQVKADCMAIGHDLDVYQPYTPVTE